MCIDSRRHMLYVVMQAEKFRMRTRYAWNGISTQYAFVELANRITATHVTSNSLGIEWT